MSNPTNEPTNPPEQTPEVLSAQSESDPAMGGLLGGGLDLGAMMEMASEMQNQMAETQRQLAEATVVGTAGGGLASVTLNGHLHLVAVSVEPEALDPEDPAVVGELVLAAWQNAHDQVARLQAEANPLSDLGGLGGLGGLLGG